MSATESSALVRVLATDSRPLMLRGIAAVVDRIKPVLELVAAESDYHSAARRAEQLRPDVVLLGGSCDGLAPMDALRLLVRCSRARILLLCDVRGVPARIEQALQAGASGVVWTDEPVERMVDAILKVVCSEQRPANWTGIVWSNPQIALGPPPEPAAAGTGWPRCEAGPKHGVQRKLPLTARELEVIRAVLAYPSAKYIAIAAMLKVSEHTVHNHLTSIYQKLNVVNRTGLLHFAITNQIAGVAEPRAHGH